LPDYLCPERHKKLYLIHPPRLQNQHNSYGNRLLCQEKRTQISRVGTQADRQQTAAFYAGIAAAAVTAITGRLTRPASLTVTTAVT